MDAIQAESAQGLTSAEAADRLARLGANDPAPGRGRSGVAQLLELFVNPLVIILIIAALASGFLGDVVDACVIMTIVLLGVAINFIQTYRSQRAVDRPSRIKPRPRRILRDAGQWRDILRRGGCSPATFCPAPQRVTWSLPMRGYCTRVTFTSSRLHSRRIHAHGEKDRRAGVGSGGRSKLPKLGLSGTFCRQWHRCGRGVRHRYRGSLHSAKLQSALRYALRKLSFNVASGNSPC